MLITLKQKEIEAALALYINDQGIVLVGKKLDIQFTAGRKEAGISAEVDVVPIDAVMDTSIKPLNIDSVGTVVAMNQSEVVAKPQLHVIEPAVATLSTDTGEVLATEQVEVAPVRSGTSLFA